MALQPVILEGPHVRLEPLASAHADGLAAAASSPQIWAWMSADLSDRDTLAQWMEQAEADAASGQGLTFAIVHKQSGRVVGSTRYLDVQPQDRGLEIGWTWYEPSAWGTVVNPEVKLLMLSHAFETWGAIRVTLKTDHLNVRSQAAIRKLGAQYEGTLRNHRIRRDGSFRHTVIFSITQDEWPVVRDGLRGRMG